MEKQSLKDRQAEVQAETRKLMYAYRAVFGVLGERTVHQIMVWEDMKRRARIELPIFQVYAIDQPLDPLRAAVADGARMFFCDLQEILRKDPEEPKPAPSVTK